MKVLVHFEQEFFIQQRMKIRSVETITLVLNVVSKQDFLRKFKDLDFVPSYIKKSAGNDGEISLGKKTMLWYLPETFKPHF